jgi:hypothetical protein
MSPVMERAVEAFRRAFAIAREIPDQNDRDVLMFAVVSDLAKMGADATQLDLVKRIATGRDQTASGFSTKDGTGQLVRRMLDVDKDGVR